MDCVDWSTELKEKSFIFQSRFMSYAKNSKLCNNHLRRIHCNTEIDLYLIHRQLRLCEHHVCSHAALTVQRHRTSMMLSFSVLCLNQFFFLFFVLFCEQERFFHVMLCKKEDMFWKKYWVVKNYNDTVVYSSLYFILNMHFAS